MQPDAQQIEANLRLHVDRLAGLIGPRYLGKPKTISATIGYIEGQWSDIGYQFSREPYDALGDQANNIIVEQTGARRADEIVLLGAHYDTVYSTPGADDNASAVAVLIEVSRLLKEHQRQANGAVCSVRVRRAAVLQSRLNGQPTSCAAVAIARRKNCRHALSRNGWLLQ